MIQDLNRAPSITRDASSWGQRYDKYYLKPLFPLMFSASSPRLSHKIEGTNAQGKVVSLRCFTSVPVSRCLREQSIIIHLVGYLMLGLYR